MIVTAKLSDANARLAVVSISAIPMRDISLFPESEHGRISLYRFGLRVRAPRPTIATLMMPRSMTVDVKARSRLSSSRELYSEDFAMQNHIAGVLTVFCETENNIVTPRLSRPTDICELKPDGKIITLISSLVRQFEGFVPSPSTGRKSTHRTPPGG